MLALTKKQDAKPAPAFEVTDSGERLIRLGDYRGKSNVVLVFNRGFF